MAGQSTSLTQKAYFDEYVDLVPVNPGRRVTFLPQVDAGAKARTFLSRFGLLLALVVLPTVLTAVYFYGFAADRYESEARFSVRRPTSTTSGMLTELLPESGPVRAGDEAFAVAEYVVSRDALKDLVDHHGFDEAMARAGSDAFWAYPSFFGTTSFESRFDYFQRIVSIHNDTTSGVSTLKVEAFRPEDAQRIANALLAGAESMINRLNDRAAAEAMTAVESQAESLRQRLEAAQTALVGFRTREEVVDPARLSLAVLQTIALMTVQLAETQATLTELQRTAPRSPQVDVLRRRIAAIESQIALERRKLGGDDDALANVIAEYESLMLEREFSQRAYSAALAAVEMTKSENRKQRVYLERIVQPQAPDDARHPSRLFWTIVVLIAGAVAYALTNMVRDRRAMLSQ